MRGADFKVVLLGNENVGKTSLMKRYILDLFFEKPHVPTIGAAYASKEVSSNGRKLIMGIWDTAGSERHHAMSPLFYRDAKAAIVCFDISDGATFARAKDWVLELRNNAEDCKIYMCATKKDVVENGSLPRGVSLERVLQYSKGFGAVYVETSSKTGENVAHLFQMIADDCKSMFENQQNLKSDESIKLNVFKTQNRCC